MSNGGLVAAMWPVDHRGRSGDTRRQSAASVAVLHASPLAARARVTDVHVSWCSLSSSISPEGAYTRDER